ncbi:MAG: MarR family transcriptional regulator [Burkholderiaceae bacterium]|nr:MarR family transcriptional regulator [Burkholderiaceae bacterium]
MAKPRKKAGGAASLQALLHEASRRATADLERVLDPEGVPLESWRVLEVLADESGRSMSALADAVSMKLPSLSKLVDRMVANALVQRALDPEDNRRVLVYISDVGLACVRRLESTVQRERQSMESALGRDRGRELKQLLEDFIRGRGS